MKLFVCAILLVVGAAGASGCGYLRAEWARSNAEQQQLDAYVIAKPLDEVWGSVTLPSGPGGSLTWSAQGWSWEDVGPWKKRTSAKSSKEKGAGGDLQDVRSWFECEGVAVPGGTQVHYTEYTERRTFREGRNIGTDVQAKRRPDLELELVRRFDPAAAQRIEAAGEAAAQKEK